MTTRPTGPAPAEDAGELAELGKRARQLRAERGMTLDELARRTGLSKGHLSRFERGEKSLSIAALLNVSNTLGVNPMSLVASGREAEAVHVVRASEGKSLALAPRSGDYAYTVLTPPRTGQFSAFKISLTPDSFRSGEVAHSGEEGCVVLNGAVEVELDGKLLLLEAGDYVQFPATRKHRMRSVGGEATIFLFVVA